MKIYQVLQKVQVNVNQRIGFVAIKIGERRLPSCFPVSLGPMALVQFQIWEKGIVDIKQLGEKLGSALRHALWDLVMEYRLLTAPIAEMPHVEESHVVCSEPSTPLKS